MDTVLRELKLPISLFSQALILIVVVWAIVAVARARDQTVRSATITSAAEALVAVSVVAIAAFTIVPLRITIAGGYVPGLGINWEPVIPVVQGLLSDEGDIAAFNAVGNLALYVPLGAALTWRFGTRLRTVLVLSLVISLTIETWQAMAPDQRSADVNDVLLNVAGAVVGALAMTLVLRLAPDLAISPRGGSLGL